MSKFKAVEIHGEIKLSGVVILPLDWRKKYMESELATEFLTLENDWEETDSEVWEEETIELTDEEARVFLHDTVDWDFVNKHLSEEDDDDDK